MTRFLTLGFGVVCYAIFFVTFLYRIGFVGNVFVPRTIDSGGAAGGLGSALLVDTGLLLLFGLQHSVMPRPRFKAWWTRFGPPAIERSTYVLASSLVLIALFAFWQPIATPVWAVENAIGSTALTVLYFAEIPRNIRWHGIVTEVAHRCVDLGDAQRAASLRAARCRGARRADPKRRYATMISPVAFGCCGILAYGAGTLPAAPVLTLARAEERERRRADRDESIVITSGLLVR